MQVGSPPPTRGTRVFYVVILDAFGITPAYAGNTLHTKSRIRCSRDHPRLRGEHFAGLAKRIRPVGSPPPTRGTHLLYQIATNCRRITPAYAGNTHSGSGEESACRDHPRLRGEHGTTAPDKASPAGSPPPTRGTLLFFAFFIPPARITPAYAGNTFYNCFANSKLWDHPRLRGEHSKIYCNRWINVGSPPPTRGTHVRG